MSAVETQAGEGEGKPAWDDPALEPAPFRPGPAGHALAMLRAPALVVLLLAGLALLLVLRPGERLLAGARRPLTAHLPRLISRAALAMLGLRVSREGTPLTGPGAVVANHVSWLDIFVLNAGQNIWFVAKAEVAAWPFIGWLARATGTLFIRRDRREAARQVALFRRRLKAGHRLLFFPEGTSTDGLRVLGFKSTLFSAFLAPEMPEDLQIQPVSMIYFAPPGQERRFYGWWGEMALGPHLFKVLACRPQGRVLLRYHAPLRAGDFSDRKALARACEARVRAGGEALRARGLPGS